MLRYLPWGCGFCAPNPSKLWSQGFFSGKKSLFYSKLNKKRLDMSFWNLEIHFCGFASLVMAFIKYTILHLRKSKSFPGYSQRSDGFQLFRIWQSIWGSISEGGFSSFFFNGHLKNQFSKLLRVCESGMKAKQTLTSLWVYILHHLATPWLSQISRLPLVLFTDYSDGPSKPWKIFSFISTILKEKIIKVKWTNTAWWWFEVHSDFKMPFEATA